MITKRCLHGISVLPIAMVGLTLGAATPAVGAAEFSEAELFFELNDTDGDLGIHSSIDDGGYSRLTITGPRKHTILKVRPRGRLAHQGLTQLFFESAEPKFDELDPPTFFRRFPEGPYDIRARSLEGDVLKATVALSHVLAAPVATSRCRAFRRRQAATRCRSVRERAYPHRLGSGDPVASRDRQWRDFSGRGVGLVFGRGR